MSPPPRGGSTRAVLALLGACAILAGCSSAVPMPPHSGRTVYASDTTVIKVRGAVRVDVAVTSN